VDCRNVAEKLYLELRLADFLGSTRRCFELRLSFGKERYSQCCTYFTGVGEAEIEERVEECVYVRGEVGQQ
jgi:hypothetical protein